MSNDIDYRKEVENGFTQLFGEAFHGVHMRSEREFDPISLYGSHHHSPPERYTLVIYVIYNIDRKTIVERVRNEPLFSLKNFVIGHHQPVKVQHNQEYELTNSGTRFVIMAEYVVTDLPEFLGVLNKEAKKAFDARFYEAIDKVVSDDSKEG